MDQRKRSYDAIDPSEEPDDTPIDPPPVSPLALVQCGLLRAAPRLASLPHVATLFTQLLDVAPLLSLADAAAMGSVRLFDRVVERVMKTTSPDDQALVDFWFARAMQAALERDDLMMLQRIHALHPAPLFVYVPVIPPIVYATPLGLAFKYGTLETVQWLVEHRADRACCAPGIRTYCRGCVLQALPCIGDRDAFRIAMWLLDCGFLDKLEKGVASRTLWRAMQFSSALVRSLHEQKPLDKKTLEALLYPLIKQRRAQDAVELLELIPAPMPVSHAQEHLLRASFAGLTDVVEKLIARGDCTMFQHKFVLAPTTQDGHVLVQWRADLMNKKERGSSKTMAEICSDVASESGNLPALQWLYSERHVCPTEHALTNGINDETTLLAIYQWMDAVGLALPDASMDAAAGKGFLTVVQWLHEHSSSGCTTNAMNDAAGNGHLDVVLWLDANRTEGCTTQAAVAAAENGHLRVVQWLHAHGKEIDVPQTVWHATARGELDVLMWLLEIYPEAKCSGCTFSHVLSGTMWTLCKIRSLDVLRWNDAQPVVLCDFCEATERHPSGGLFSAMNDGDLELVKYVYSAHRDKVHFADPPKTVRRVTQCGHLGVLQWIDERYGVRHGARDAADEFEQWDGDWTEAIEEANEFGYPQILAWIRSIQDEA